MGSQHPLNHDIGRREGEPSRTGGVGIREEGSRLWVVLVATVIMVALGGTVAVAQGVDLPFFGDSEPEVVPIEALQPAGPDACQPVMFAYRAGDPSADGLTSQGLVAETLPAGIADMGIRSISCLADNLAGRLEMLILSIGGAEEVGQLVIPHAQMSDTAVRAYLTETAPGAPILPVDAIDSRVLLVVSDVERLADLRAASATPAKPLWLTIIGQKNDRR